MDKHSSKPGIRMPEATRARVIAVRENLVTIEAENGPIKKNEVGYILVGQERLMAEVLRVEGRHADMQVFEDTGGIKVGDRVELTSELLSVSLGPGLLGQVYDGLQKPLADIARDHGFFLPRGVRVLPLDHEKTWTFTPVVQAGDQVRAGQVIGYVPEGPFRHYIMAPNDLTGQAQVIRILHGAYTIETPIAWLKSEDQQELALTMVQRWPVRKPLSEALLDKRLARRLYPSEPMTTTQRIIDTFYPIARGGTACIPGPFGAGKTVLQGLIARHASVDIVIIVACGERAGEVVETITEYPQMKDPKTGGSLMDRTIIICNTSAMPVAARESSIYTGMTLGEYYRQMGYHVLLIADSTSRWAQALRETSGRMEEIPGEEAFPAYLDSNIKSIYERAGIIENEDNRNGSLTMIGTVSPAGGNFDEPVTQATLATVKTFLGLSADRAYRRYYPAIDPLISWSRYFDQLDKWYDDHYGPTWMEDVHRFQDLIHQGDGINQMMQVSGEEGISIEDYVVYQKALLLDMVYLQQDAFDEVDVSVSQERQRESFTLLKTILDREYSFESKDKARDFFIRLTGLYKNFNYTPAQSPDYQRYRREIEALAQKHGGLQQEQSDMGKASAGA